MADAFRFQPSYLGLANPEQADEPVQVRLQVRRVRADEPPDVALQPQTHAVHHQHAFQVLRVADIGPLRLAYAFGLPDRGVVRLLHVMHHDGVLGEVHERRVHALCGDCTCGGRDLLGIRHVMTDLRHDMTTTRCDLPPMHEACTHAGLPHGCKLAVFASVLQVSLLFPLNGNIPQIRVVNMVPDLQLLSFFAHGKRVVTA